MAGEKHLYLVASGGYISATTALAQEIWQFGVRLIFTPNVDIPSVGTFANDWDVVAATIDRTEADWTITSNWTTEGGFTDLDPGDYLNDQAGPAVEAFIQTTALFSAATQLRTLRLYPIQAPDGKVIPAPPYAQGSPALLTYTGTLPAGAGSGTTPPQLSAVVSMRTQQVGRRGRGRIYPPPMGSGSLGVSAEAGVVASSTRTALAGAAATLLEALTIVNTDPVDMTVAPIVTGAPYTNYARVTNVRVGSVWDGQVRRRRSITEVYTTENVEQSP